MESEGCSALIKLSGVRSAPPVRKKKANVKFEGVLGKQMDLLFGVREGFFFSSVQPTFTEHLLRTRLHDVAEETKMKIEQTLLSYKIIEYY